MNQIRTYLGKYKADQFDMISKFVDKIDTTKQEIELKKNAIKKLRNFLKKIAIMLLI